MVQRICATQLTPDDPVMGFLRNRGYDLGGIGGVQRFAGDPSPLRGKRWYLPISIRGQAAEFLVDTGASHSMIGKDFYRSLAVASDEPLGSDRVCSADRSEMQTFGRQVLPFMTMGSSFVISPTVAELTDEGILGLDFCSLYGVILDGLTG